MQKKKWFSGRQQWQDALPDYDKASPLEKLSLIQDEFERKTPSAFLPQKHSSEEVVKEAVKVAPVQPLFEQAPVSHATTAKKHHKHHKKAASPLAPSQPLVPIVVTPGLPEEGGIPGSSAHAQASPAPPPKALQNSDPVPWNGQNPNVMTPPAKPAGGLPLDPIPWHNVEA